MSKHENFILTPMSRILEDVVLASSGIGAGIETYPLCDYLMQSTFLKVTGFQEQKARCIAWEIATHDFEFRRELLNNKHDLGEYSRYKAKNTIYKKLCDQILKFYPEFEFNNTQIKKRVKTNSTVLVKNIFKNTNLATWSQKSFDQYVKTGIKFIKDTQYLCNQNNLVENIIQEEYELLYKQRNRIAHNVSSYQQNLPNLNNLKEEKNYERNYFFWFSILLLIDNIFIELYKAYRDGLENQVW